MIRVWGAVERDGVIICEVRDIAGRAGLRVPPCASTWARQSVVSASW